MFYALKDTIATTIAAAICASVNITLDLISLKYFGALGIAMSNTISSLVMSLIALTFLYKRHKILFYWRLYARFFAWYALQVALGCIIFWLGLIGLQNVFGSMVMHGLGFWLATSTLAALIMVLMFMTRDMFRIRVYFLRK
jgi:peptidoglycan biosynthesis protein MviN/MurJ (putative lipid II flippase)